MWLHVCMYVCLSVCLYVCLYVCLSVCLSVSLSVPIPLGPYLCLGFVVGVNYLVCNLVLALVPVQLGCGGHDHDSVASRAGDSM